MLRSNISAREREKAERATLVQQDKLIKAKVGRGLLSCQVGADMPAAACTWGAEPVTAGAGAVDVDESHTLAPLAQAVTCTLCCCDGSFCEQLTL